MTYTTTNVHQLLDSQFPGGDCTIEAVSEYLKDLLADHTVINMWHSLLSTDGEEIELGFSLEIKLRDDRVVFAHAANWYNGGRPQDGVDLIENFNLLDHCDSIAAAWVEQRS